jgi:hypothetical protein
MTEKNRKPHDSSIESQPEPVVRYLQRLGIPDEEIPGVERKIVSLRANIEAEILRYREKSQRP